MEKAEIAFREAAWEAAAKAEEPKRDRSPVVNRSLRNAVRRDVLLVARKRSPELAARWLEEMVEESTSAEKDERGTFDDRSARSAVLLHMANELVTESPGPPQSYSLKAYGMGFLLIFRPF